MSAFAPDTRRAPLAGLLLTCLLFAPRWAWSQDALLARNLAASCSTCHAGAAPSELRPLAGLPTALIRQRLAEFKTGQAPNATVMPQIVKGYSDEQLGLIAGYLSAQPAAAR